MRVVMVQLERMFPPIHGGARACRAVAERLATLGHDVTVLGTIGDHDPVQSLTLLRREAVSVREKTSGAVEARVGRLHVRAVPALRLLPFLEVWLDRLAPDLVLTTDDGEQLAGALLALVARAAPGRWAYLPKTVHRLPCGPASIFPDPLAAGVLASALAIVVPSRFVAQYVEAHAGVRPEAVYFPLYAPPTPPVGERDLVLMINPSAWKGAELFVALAREERTRRFGWVPGWGTTGELERVLASLPNVVRVEPTQDHAALFGRARALLVPSLCLESFGQVAVQAMQRGVPVLASDLGGLRESALGAASLLPVRPIRFEPTADGVAQSVPSQEIGPWRDALGRLEHPTAYADAGHRAHAAATTFVESLSWAPFERALRLGRS